jgi:endo-1,4-beta-xylanase
LGSQTRLRIEMSADNGKAAWISLADLPFRNYGEWYMGYRRVTIFKDLAGFFDGYSIEFRDGLKPEAITIPLPAVGDAPFLLNFLDASGRHIQIQDLAGNTLYEFTMPGIDYEGTSLSLPDGLFPEQIAYLSCASDGPTTVTFKEPTMTRAPIGLWEDPWKPPPGLRELAEAHGIETMVPGEGWRLGDVRYSAVVHQTASMLLLLADAPIFWLGKASYNFDYMDHLVEATLQNNQKIMMGIVYGPAPETVPEDIRNGNYTQAEYRDILHDYVTSVVCRYHDQVSVWSIGNESVGARAINYPDFWAEKVGPDYVDLAFQWARECDPDGILLLNDSINDSLRDPETTLYVNAMLAAIQSMKARGVPVDAVGIQGHFFLPWNSMIPPTKDDVIQTMQDYAALGVSVYITELDVTLTNVPGNQQERWSSQAGIYRLMMDACLESGVCRGFGVWGINDSICFGMCFSEDACPPSPLPEPLWFDDNFNPKPAFVAVLESLQEH